MSFIQQKNKNIYTFNVVLMIVHKYTMSPSLI